MENFEKNLEMPHQTEPENVKVESEGTAASSLESKRKIASETGKFYSSLLDTYLEVKTPEEQQEQTGRLTEALPGPMKKLYTQGLNEFREELVENHKLLKEHGGAEASYLLREVMISMGKSPEEMDQIFQQINNVKFVELSPGIIILQAEKDFFKLLKEHGIVHVDGHAVNFGSDNRGQPSFLMIQRMSLETSLAEDSSQAKDKGSIRHELHHFIWNFLQRRGDFLREISETSPELTKAFGHFRDEIAAYIIEGRGVRYIEPELLTYSQDSKILEMATSIRDFTVICVEIAKLMGADKNSFLYAAMSSRNFAELKNNFEFFTPLEKIDQTSLGALYATWINNYAASSKIVELLERKNIIIPQNLIEEYGMKRLGSADLTSTGKLFSELENVKKFAQTVKSSFVNERAMLEKALRTRLQLPKETVAAILLLPREQSSNIPLDKTGEDFLKSLISFWNINQESIRAVYKQIIDSSPIMRGYFNQAREGIINQGAELYRSEFRLSNEERRVKAEIEIQDRTKLLMEL